MDDVILDGDRQRRIYAVDFAKSEEARKHAQPCSDADYDPLNDREEVMDWEGHPLDEANVVSSECVDGQHRPVLDLDFECQLVPSSTPGHFHLYLDGLALPWWKYDALLKALADAGVIQHGYYTASRHRRATMVRLPGVSK